MKYIHLLLTIVASSLIISSIKLEAMETVRRKGIRGLKEPQTCSTNNKNLTHNQLASTITSPKRQPRLEYHQNSASDKFKNPTTNSEWLKKLVQSSLDNQKNFKKRQNRYNPQASSLEAQRQKLKHIQEKILPRLRHDCRESPPDTYWGAKILELLITKPESLKLKMITK